MKIKKVADYDKGTFGPAVQEVTQDNFKSFQNLMHDWRAKFIRASVELERLNPQEGSIDYKRMKWAQNMAITLDEAMSGNFGNSILRRK
jgi:hypothetical protein